MNPDSHHCFNLKPLLSPSMVGKRCWKIRVRDDERPVVLVCGNMQHGFCSPKPPSSTVRRLLLPSLRNRSTFTYITVKYISTNTCNRKCRHSVVGTSTRNCCGYNDYSYQSCICNVLYGVCSGDWG